MKVILLTFLAIFLFPILVSAQSPTVEFKCNMSVQIKRGTFDPATDSVWVRGNFNDWAGKDFLLTDQDGDSVYSGTYSNFAVGQALVFKYVRSLDTWEATGNRSLTVTAGINVSECFWEDINVYVPKKYIQVIFTINMELERLKGLFNPATDYVGVRGSFSGWCGAGASTTSTSGDENLELRQRCETILTPSQTNPDLYEGVVTIAAEVDDIVTFKFYHSPDVWEIDNLIDMSQSGRYFVVSQQIFDDGIMLYEAIGFNNETLETVLNQDAHITFTCNTNGAKIVNAPLETEFKTIHIAGGHLPLQWPSGGWPDIDSIKMIKLYDDGTHDDAIAGDKIFTTTITFPIYTPIFVNYKYSANWGTSTNGGSNDNEKLNLNVDAHDLVMYKTVSQGVVADFWGIVLRQCTCDVRKLDNKIPSAFKLEQNYPNPFNPETKISWQIAQSSFVTLKVYDVLGNEVATLVKEEQSEGNYQVGFNNKTNELSSGIYFYQLRAGDFVQTKKMILLR